MHLEIFAFVAGFINQISSDKFASTIGGYSEWGGAAPGARMAGPLGRRGDEDANKYYFGCNTRNPKLLNQFKIRNPREKRHE